MLRTWVIASVAAGALALSKSPPHPGAAFVHLFEWSWTDVAQECEEFLGPKGFSAVQVSPPNEHIVGGQWWTRYQPVTYNLSSRSGDEQAFVAMVKRCNASGVAVYADAVINHIAANSGVGVAGSPFGNRATPIYSPEDMHHAKGDDQSNCQVTNYQDKFNVQNCDLVGLPDLCTGCEKVQAQVALYLTRLGQLGVAGVRIDAAKHQDAEELGHLLSRVSGDMYVFHEVIAGAKEAVWPQMYFGSGQVTEFNYARQLAPNVLEDGKLQYLHNFGEAWGLIPTSSAVVFMDNHDTQRGEAQLTYKNGKFYELANIFMLAHPYGYPKVMSSYFFDDRDAGPPQSPVHGSGLACGGGPNSNDAPWVCEHRWLPIANMVAWRRTAGDAGVEKFQAPGADTIAFCRGSLACIALNRQDSAMWTARVTLTVPVGTYCNIIVSDDPASCPRVEVAADGSASVQVPPLGAVAVHVGKRLAAEPPILA
mmetsp:Transcript_97432/g.281112  ORF Transcript_97432/g.281112 Transcript_97432/m.281112 type:complete len:479 (+) Transcript_97432:42-1478(+)|eukprot:CAMPEP_0176045658 /NCGR_PEP_ID=MMETSP0120_2-20121206/22666_1 /TAXON_ID=160619 /ORGANISM="Kryptoperidinium foliaceum, Strain CCMP 1326" /LENGTH=478 /DNA_ID=CAMNT_0017379065 /DNA_START=40 /DNA_END=1476 /DNA_ORIENTATION=-